MTTDPRTRTVVIAQVLRGKEKADVRAEDGDRLTQLGVQTLDQLGLAPLKKPCPCPPSLTEHFLVGKAGELAHPSEPSVL